MKKNPEKAIGDEVNRVLRLSDHWSKLISKVAGYKSIKDYF